MGLFYNKSKQADLKDTLREIEPFYGLPGILEYDYIIGTISPFKDAHSIFLQFLNF